MKERQPDRHELDACQSTERLRFRRTAEEVACCVVGVLAVVIAVAAGFVGFLSQLRGTEAKPSRTADGIVVLTGGSSRVSDAMELLADGYGRRLL